MIEVNNTEYKVDGYIGRWSCIDTKDGYALLEHTFYGDETDYLVVKQDAKIEQKKFRRNLETVTLPVIKEVVTETLDDLETTLDEINGI